MIDARREIVKIAKDIAMGDVNTISDDLSSLDRAKSVSNIGVVIMDEREVMPTLQVKSTCTYFNRFFFFSFLCSSCFQFKMT